MHVYFWRLLLNVNISVGTRNLLIKDFEIITRKKGKVLQKQKGADVRSLTNLSEVPFSILLVVVVNYLGYCVLFAIAIRLAQQVGFFFKIYCPIVKSLREYNTMLYVLDLWCIRQSVLWKSS